MKFQNGSILVSTGLLLSIISLIIIKLFEEALFFNKIFNIRFDSINKFYQLETFVNTINDYSGCVSNIDEPNLAIKNLYQNLGCNKTINNLNYLYFIENLGEFPCMQIANQPSYQWRISAKQIPGTYIVQSRIAKPIHKDILIKCKHITYISKGIISERLIKLEPTTTT